MKDFFRYSNLGKYLFFTIFIFLFNGYCYVNAATLTATDIDEKIDYIFYWKKSDGNYDSGYLKNFAITDNGIERIAYCIEPYVPETTLPNGYTEATWEDIGLAPEIKQEILLIAYYGYQYPGHNTQKYRAATQALLWKTILNSKYGDENISWDVSYKTKYYDTSQEKYIENDYDVSLEQEIISNLVKHHNDKPSFNEKAYSSLVGEAITITDESEVLENYEVYETDGALVSINGNNLTIIPTEIGTVELKFIRKQVYQEAYFVYYAKEFQNMITGGNIDPVYFSITLTGLTKEETIDDKEVVQVVNVPNTGLGNINFKTLSTIISGITGFCFIIYGIKNRKKTS